MVEVRAVEGVEQPRPWCQPAQEEILGREPPESRVAANRTLQRPVRVEQPGTDHADARIILGKGGETGDCVVDRPGIAVEHEQIATARHAEPLVHRRSVASVFVQLDEADA